MRKLSTEIRRDELVTIRKLFSPWEIPLLKAIHGGANVVVKGEVDDESKYPTSASSEYARLVQAFPKFEDTNGDIAVPVEVAFGKAEGGVMNLGNSIRAAIKDAKSRPPKAPPPDEVPQEEGDVIDGDAIDEDELPVEGAPKKRRKPKQDNEPGQDDPLIA